MPRPPADRPWSGAEIEGYIREIMHRQDEVRAELLEAGQKASRAKWRYEHRYAQALAMSEGSNAERRKASAMLHIFETQGPDGLVTKKMTEYGMEMDFADIAYKAKMGEQRALENELKVCQSLLVSSRQP